MGAKSKIEWTDRTYNYWEGCSGMSPACAHCYAEARNARFSGGIAINWGHGAPRRLTSEYNRNNLERWNKVAFFECGTCGHRGTTKRRAPGQCVACGGADLHSTRQRVFCSSLSDVFDNEVDPAWRVDLFAKMLACTNLDILVLTKRVGNVRKMVPASWLEPGAWPAHIRIGATIANQEEAERDLPKLLALPAPNFVSIEPQLGAISLSRVGEKSGLTFNALVKKEGIGFRGNAIEWVICGGESGTKARPMHPDWPRQLRDDCADAGVPFLFKQHGEWAPGSGDFGAGKYVTAAVARDGRVAEGGYGREDYPGDAQASDGWAMVHRAGKKVAGRHLDGRTWDGVPA